MIRPNTVTLHIHRQMSNVQMYPHSEVSPNV